MAIFMKTVWNVEGAILLLLPIAGTAFAADDDALFRILMWADTAHNLATYCAQFDPLLLKQTRGSQGDMQELSRHIRDEVIAGLPTDEAHQVVLRSAKAAQVGALMTIRQFYGPDPDEERARLKNWCEVSVAPSLKQFVRDYDEHHEAFEESIREAKGVVPKP
jgi:hypothetical protein